MRKPGKHIAFFLLGVFFFSISLQSIHILWHHAHNNKSEHHQCAHDLTEKHTNIVLTGISEREKSCVVCEYQFYISELTEALCYDSIIPEFSYTYKGITPQQHLIYIYSFKTPRAPPAQHA